MGQAERPAQPDDEPDPAAACTVVADHLRLNLDREAAALEPLEAALRLAEALLDGGSNITSSTISLPEWDGYSRADLLAVVHGCARLYAGLGYRLRAAGAWRLLLRAAQLCQDAELVVTAACELLEVNLCPDQLDWAAVEAAVVASTDPLTKHRWSVASAWRLYHDNQAAAVVLTRLRACLTESGPA